jgi:hypothetical protein
MIMVRVKSEEECRGVLDKARAEGHCVILSVAGVLVIDDKRLAISMLHQLAMRFSAHTNQEMIAILIATDPYGYEVIGFGLETPGAVVMHGVTRVEFMAEMEGYTAAGLGELEPEKTIN